MIDNYLSILEDSLKKKIVVLDKISIYNTKQSELLSKEGLTAEELNQSMEEKDELIEQLSELDSGFETLYDRIREQLSSNKDAYKAQIARLQELIREVTEKTVSIQAQEERNKRLVDNYFLTQRRQLKQNRQSSQTAYGYFKNMNGSSVVPPQFLDQKQ